MRKTLLRWMLPAVAAALVLAGCSNSETPSTSQGSSTTTSSASEQTAHNDADVSFAQNMVPHHQQALEMARLASTRASSAKVKDLASRIEKAQDPEIQQMNAWLAKWGAMPTSSMPSVTGMNHGSMPGGMTDAEMRQLEQATGSDFDKMFLELMIKHHQGAVEVAKTALDKGKDADARALAQRIIDAQQAEITEMQGLLKPT